MNLPECVGWSQTEVIIDWDRKWLMEVMGMVREESDLIFQDMVCYGRAFIKDGKHIPLKDVLINEGLSDYEWGDVYEDE